MKLPQPDPYATEGRRNGAGCYSDEENAQYIVSMEEGRRWQNGPYEVIARVAGGKWKTVARCDFKFAADCEVCLLAVRGIETEIHKADEPDPGMLF